MIQRLSGDQAGEEWYLVPRVSSVATPVAGSIDHMEPLMPTAIAVPSGDHAGAHGVELGAGGK